MSCLVPIIPLMYKASLAWTCTNVCIHVRSGRCRFSLLRFFLLMMTVWCSNYLLPAYSEPGIRPHAIMMILMYAPSIFCIASWRLCLLYAGGHPIAIVACDLFPIEQIFVRTHEHAHRRDASVALLLEPKFPTRHLYALGRHHRPGPQLPFSTPRSEDCVASSSRSQPSKLIRNLPTLKSSSAPHATHSTPL